MTGPSVEFPDRAAPLRALGLNRRLRWLSVVLWASFLGAAAGLMSVLLLPENWVMPPLTPEDAALVFGLFWLLALVPAVLVGILLGPEQT